jgi:SAM-dependent methyltransferase
LLKNISGRAIGKFKRLKLIAPMRLAWRRIGEDTRLSEVEAFWKEKRNDTHNSGKHLFEYIANDVNLSEVDRVLEFGAGFGQNLGYFLENGDLSETVGIDINPAVKELESRWPNYHGIIGNQKEMGRYSNGYFDVAFTFSVLDHIPSRNEVRKIIQELARISKFSYLAEPYIQGIEGDVSGLPRAEIQSGLPNPHKVFAPYSYFWDYVGIAQELGLKVSLISKPIYPQSFGPFYHFFKVSE